MNQNEQPYRKLRLLNDQSLAKLLDVSVAWVRQQKSNRKHGKEHALEIDPVQIGGTTRYRLCDVEEWLSKQEPKGT